MNGTYDEEYRILHGGWLACRLGSRPCLSREAMPVARFIASWASPGTSPTAGMAEDKMREQASLLDKARDAILVRDLDHGITYWNKSAERALRLDRRGGANGPQGLRLALP
jgi:PAS domain-containing protein